MIRLLSLLAKENTASSGVILRAMDDELNSAESFSLTDEERDKLCLSIEERPLNEAVLFYSLIARKLSDYGLSSCLARFVFSNRNKYPVESQNYLFFQTRLLCKETQAGEADETDSIFDDWNAEIIETYRELFQEELIRIPFEDRNKDLIFVLAGQVLGWKHSPTKVVFDWCRSLINLGKNVFLINTAELTSEPNGRVPFYAKGFNYVPEYMDCSYLEYGDCRIPFFQCPLGMPDNGVIGAVIDIIKENRPELIISIGDRLVTSIVDKVTDVYSVGLSADMPHSHTAFRSVYRQVNEYDRRWLELNGYDENGQIKAVFTYELPECGDPVVKGNYGIDDETVVIGVVGNRLDREMSDEFLSMLDRIFCVYRCCLFIVGSFDLDRLMTYNHIYGSHVQVEYADNLIDLSAVFDIYVNPPRQGGGTSALYAMSNSVPVVTMDGGDVSLNAGECFSVSDLDEAYDRIRRLIDDREFYTDMSIKAKQRAAVISDTMKSVEDQMTELEKRVALSV